MLKELRGYIGMVNYYRDMQPHRAHILTPLTSQTGAPKQGQPQQKYVWTEEMQAAFDQMKALMAMDVLCTYLNHNKPFHMYVNPYVVTNSFLKWGFPKWKFLAIPACMQTGIPVWKRGFPVW